jgi:hypothetical protein
MTMDRGILDKIDCFLLSSNTNSCDRRCGVRQQSNSHPTSLPLTLINQEYKIMKNSRPFPLEMIEIPLNYECNWFSELILFGECAVQSNFITRLNDIKKEYALLLCFCPDSVNEPKIVKKIADLIEQLCIHKIRLLIAKNSCCKIGNSLIEKTKAILGNYELEFKMEILN